MKTIVFATDFSKGSRKAAHTAAQVAAKTQAKLVLFNAYRYIMPNEPEIISFIISGDKLEKKAINSLKRLKYRLQKKYPACKNIEVNAQEGLVVDTLSKIIGDVNADLLVMGTVGESPLGAKYFGSIATSMIHHSHIPMLLVPPKTKYSMFRNAVLGLDFSHEIDKELLNKTINILRDLDCPVNLFTATDETEYAKTSALEIREMLINVPHTFTVSQDSDFTISILNFAKKNQADLIITFPRKHNFFERFFVESNTERLALNNEIPILTVI